MSKDEQTTELTEPTNSTKRLLFLLRGDATDEEIEDLLDQMFPDEQETQLTHVRR